MKKVCFNHSFKKIYICIYVIYLTDRWIGIWLLSIVANMFNICMLKDAKICNDALNNKIA